MYLRVTKYFSLCIKLCFGCWSGNRLWL